MFSSRSEPRSADAYPTGSLINKPDWDILAGFWHPVAFAHEVGAQPLAVRLLDVPLVLYRTGADRSVTVARDRCPHRGVRLSLGRISGGRLICPMHGLHFDAAGRCDKIPSIGEPSAPISPRMRLQTCRSAQRYGIVWVCLRPPPRWPLPEWRGIDNPAYKKVFMPPELWHTSAPRHVENFNDLAHFPWVHAQSFGSDDGFAVPEYAVEDTAYGLRFEFPYQEGGNRFPDGVRAVNRRVRYTYEFTFPFATLLVVDPEGSDFIHYFADVACPVSATETRVFQLLTDTSGDPDAEFWVNDSLQINADDKPLVESQPAALPLHPGHELHHLPADRWSLRYRQRLIELFGLGG